MSLRAAIIGLRLRADTIAFRLKATYKLGQFLIFRTFADSALLADTPLKALFKNLADNSSISDEPSLAINKPLINSTALTDNDQLLIGKRPSDITSITDDFFFNIGQQLIDVTGVNDAERRDATKLLVNSWSASEAHSKYIVKPIYEFYAFEYFAEDYTRTLTQISFSDDDQLLIGKRPSDSVALAETQQFAATKLITETVFATDDLDGEASAEDDQEIRFFKSLSHLLSAADDVLISPTKVLSNAASLADDGSARGQGYADFTYFSDDYVGYSWTF